MLDGVALAALDPDGSLALYLGTGMVAAVNPCGFAMLPAYLSYFLGHDPAAATTARTAGTATATGTGTGGTGAVTRQDRNGGARGAPLGRAVQVALAVSAGFAAVFAAAGAVVELSSLPVYQFMPWVSVVIGLALVALGIAMVAGVAPTLRLPKLERGGHDRTVPSMFVFGASYAVASIGCTLPTFLAAVAGTMERESVVDGLVVFAAYAAGMAVVLTALTVAIALARTSVVRFVRAARPYLDTVAGVLVTLAGAYVAYYGTIELRTQRSRPGEVPSSGITDVVTGWSYDIKDWIDRTGPVRITLAVVLALGALAVGTQALKARRHEARGRDGESAPSGTGAGDPAEPGATTAPGEPVKA